jgi:hypothetical protein
MKLSTGTKAQVRQRFHARAFVLDCKFSPIVSSL